MTEPQTFRRHTIKRFCRRRPREMTEGIINLVEEDWAGDSDLEFDERRQMPLAMLDDLPLELLYSTFRLLEFKALMSFTETCTRGLTVGRSLPEYRDLINYALQTLRALSRTGLIVYQSAAKVHSALLTTACVSCGNFGAFLFLPTCERSLQTIAS